MQEATSGELTEIQELIAQGRLVESVDALVALNRRHRDPHQEIELVDLRARAAVTWDPGQGREPWPPEYDDPFPAVAGDLPEIDRLDLTTEVLGGAIAHHGALIVRRALEPAVIESLVRLMDAIHERDRSSDPLAPGLFHPLRAHQQANDAVLRKWVAEQGGTWLADSPAGTALALDALADAGLVDAIAAHLGERPFFSLQKSTLRRSLPEFALVSWHQDGAFLTQGVRTVNTWVALSSCGGDRPTPGLEVVPRRFDRILPADGELIQNSVSTQLVAELALETPTVVPEFAPGDALVFDERFLHRTYLTESMTDIRYALECWFFAPSHRAEDYTPLLV